MIREGWTEEGAGDISTPQILEMRKLLEQMRQVVKERASLSLKRQNEYYNRKTSTRILSAGDQVFVLLPNNRNSLKLEWTEPYKIKRPIGAVD